MSLLQIVMPCLLAIVLLIVFVVLFKVKKMKPKPKGDFTINARKQQSKNNFRNSSAKLKLEKKFEDRVKITKKYKYNALFEQAGLDLRYGEYKLICIGVFIASFIIFSLLLGSLPIALFLSIAASNMPKELIVVQRNRRVAVLEKQVGSFLKLSIERYKITTDFAMALKECLPDFVGQEPFYTELSKTVLEVELNTPVEDALDNLARRCGNLYLKRLATYYRITKELGTAEAREETLNQAYIQYEENIQTKELLKQQIQGPKTEAYIMLGAIPAMFAYQTITNKDYLPFMLNTTMGQVGTIFLIAVCAIAFWFINAKIGAPIDKTSNKDEVTK